MGVTSVTIDNNCYPEIDESLTKDKRPCDSYVIGKLMY